jgi:hypothetical protein
MGWKWFFQEAINFILEIGSRHGYSRRKYESEDNDLDLLEFGEL